VTNETPDQRRTRLQRERYQRDRLNPSKVEAMRVKARDMRAQRREARAAREGYRGEHPYARGSGRRKLSPHHDVVEAWVERERRWCPSPPVAESDWMKPITRAMLMARR